MSNFVFVANAQVTENFSNETGKNGVLSEFYRATGGVGVTSEGVGLASEQSGTIVINSMPDGSVVKRAWLYWGGYMLHSSEEELSTINFNGIRISPTTSPQAVLIGEKNPKTSEKHMRQAYRADVSNLVNSDGNGSYEVSVDHRSIDTFGASLVIVYEDDAVTEGLVVINDGMVMISNIQSSDLGAHFTSAISNFTLNDPANGEITIVVSEGADVDENELIFIGSTEHNFGDFAANTDGDYWDNIMVDVTDYLSTEMHSASVTLYDTDNAGSYSHYYLNIFSTTAGSTDLAESTMMVSNLNPNPGDTLTYLVTIPNKGRKTANNVKFRIDLDGNADYVNHSVMLNGSSKNDTAAEVNYQSAQKQLEVNVGSIAAGAAAEIIFHVKMHDNLGHNAKEEKQGVIVADSWTSLTDGDGDPTDGVDSPTSAVIQGGKVIDVPSGFQVYLKNAPSIDPSITPRTGVNNVVGKKNEEVVFSVDLDLNDDKSIAGVSAQKDRANKKALVHWDNGLPEGVDSYTLIIPTASTDNRVRLCLGATSLDQIEPGCASAYENVTAELVLANGETSSGITCNAVTSTEWQCSGVTGSGGQGEEGEEGGGGGGVPEFTPFALLISILGAFYFLEKGKCGFQRAC